MRLQDLLYAAEADSYNILREKKSWQYIIEIGDQWAIAIGHLTEAIDLLKKLTWRLKNQKLTLFLCIYYVTFNNVNL